MSAIKIENLSHIYRRHFWSKPKKALSNLSLCVEEGEVFGYLGSNGAGKTTTIKTLVGLLTQEEGRAEIFGVDTRDVKSRLAVGFQPENPYFYEYLTAEEALRFYGALCRLSRSDRIKRSDELLQFVGLDEAASVRVGEFSKGMRQRLGIAQALIHRPRLVILDEPQSGLDPGGRLQVRRIIENLKEEGLTVFFSSHILADVELVADRVGLLVEGNLKAVGAVAELVDKRTMAIEVVVEGLGVDKAEKALSEAESCQNRAGRFTAVFSDWNSCDRGVDKVRKAGGAIRGVREDTESLEEYFMRSNKVGRSEVGSWRPGGER